VEARGQSERQRAGTNFAFAAGEFLIDFQSSQQQGQSFLCRSGCPSDALGYA
jgi:hypothetical protein